MCVPLSSPRGSAGSLLLSLGLTWFDMTSATGWVTYGPTEYSAWQRFHGRDVVLAILAALALLVPHYRSAAVAAAGCGWLAVALIVGQIVFAPDPPSPAAGAFVALLAAVLTWTGALLSLREERHAVNRRASGLVLLGSLFLPWYGTNVGVFGVTNEQGFHVPGRRDSARPGRRSRRSTCSWRCSRWPSSSPRAGARCWASSRSCSSSTYHSTARKRASRR